MTDFEQRLALASNMSVVLWNAGWKPTIQLSEATWAQAYMAASGDDAKNWKPDKRSKRSEHAKTKLLVTRMLHDRWLLSHPGRKSRIL